MERTPSALKFGGAIHKSVETFYRGRMKGGNPGLDEVLATYHDAWEEPSDAPVQFGKNESSATLKDMAERMLAAFLETVKPGKILAIEESFAVEISDGLLVSGIVDLVELKAGKFWVVDNKTAKNSPSDAFDKEQVSLYRLGLQELGLIPEGADVGLRYDVLRKLKTKGEFIQVEVDVTDEELLQLKQKLIQVAHAMEQGIVYRVHGWMCDGCPWSKTCSEVDLAEA
jgi:CRISPR/Cas system-associated exonuclease Cas4 (RecB family)